MKWIEEKENERKKFRTPHYKFAIFSRLKPPPMRRFKKIMKWTGIVILSLVTIFVTLVFSFQNRKFTAAYPNIHATTDTSVIARGRYLAFGPAHCSGCHSPKSNDEKINRRENLPLMGGREFDLPIGKIYSRNITPDDESGIGKLPDSVIARSLRYGVSRDGRALFDFYAISQPQRRRPDCSHFFSEITRACEKYSAQQSF